MQELAKSHASLPAVSELNATLSELVPQIAQHGTFNFVLSQGDALWAHCSTKLHYLVRQHPFGLARLQDEDMALNFAELAKPGDRVAVIATEPSRWMSPGWRSSPGSSSRLWGHTGP